MEKHPESGIVKPNNDVLASARTSTTEAPTDELAQMYDRSHRENYANRLARDQAEEDNYTGDWSDYGNSSDEDLSSSDGWSEDSEDEDENDGDEEELAGRENSVVCCLRGVVLLVIFGASLLTSMVVYTVSRNSEEHELESRFQSQGQQVLDAVSDRIALRLGALEVASLSITSSVSSSLWPLNTVPNFADRANSIRELSRDRGSFVALAPIVDDSRRAEWEAYSVLNKNWIDDGIAFQRAMLGMDESSIRIDPDMDQDWNGVLDLSSGISSSIYRIREIPSEAPFGGTTTYVPEISEGSGPYLPVWEHFPTTSALVNLDLLSSIDSMSLGLLAVKDSQKAVIGRVVDTDPRNKKLQRHIARIQKESTTDDGAKKLYTSEPFGMINFPIFNVHSTSSRPRRVVAVLVMTMFWSSLLEGILPDDNNGIIVVLHNQCGSAYTFQIDGSDATFIGPGDLHDTKYDNVSFHWQLADKRRRGTPLNDKYCPFIISVHMSEDFRATHVTPRPGIYTSFIALVFVFTLLVFVAYDYIVERRQRLVLKTAIENRAIVANLFPSAIRDRLFHSGETGSHRGGGGSLKKGKGRQSMSSLTGAASSSESAPLRIKTFLSDDPAKQADDEGLDADDDPIADLFPHSTVLFADIAGFTAWSSKREPTQVFMLLQTLYQAFDKLAKKLGVFKIETIGDCYVAVTGLPEPQGDHAVRMARFARECVHRTQDLVKKLEVTLGPGTDELCMRVGMHSGPVTAGVLRGEKSRFQLFGDTVNTAARMESTGERNKIQVSSTTGELLREGGKESWLREREDVVVAKGKGEMRTFWVKPRDAGYGMSSSVHHLMYDTSSHNDTRTRTSSEKRSSTLSESNRSIASISSNEQEEDDDEVGRSAPAWSNKMIKDSIVASEDAKKERFADWYVDLFTRLLKQVMARRSVLHPNALPDTVEWDGRSISLLDEVVDIIEFERVDLDVVAATKDYVDAIDLEPKVTTQIRDFVWKIASMYKGNSFHNFEHSVHVTMSTNKLFNRLQKIPFGRVKAEQSSASPEDLEYALRICHDPMAHLAIVVASLCHDVDHSGLSNMDLVRSKSEVTQLYGKRSVAEQNSIDVGWELLMDVAYSDLQKCIYMDRREMDRFRQLVVNLVIATDVFDPRHKSARQRRWEEAFGASSSPESFSAGVNKGSIAHSKEELHNLRATVMMEYIIQASDVAHTMQHWHIYRKWNERLFVEMTSAYRSGLASKDPTENWYESELDFFDHYVIPLARKLGDCGAFGTVTSGEYVQYATENRSRWMEEGAGIVDKMIVSLD